MGDKYEITPEVIARAEAMWEQERIKDLTLGGLFSGGLYSLMSAYEDHKTHIERYRYLVTQDLDTPEAITVRQNEVKGVICGIPGVFGGMHWPNKKLQAILDYAEYWPAHPEIPQMILDDIAPGQEEGYRNGFTIRNLVARTPSKDGVPGLGYKCASMWFRMVGYDYLVPFDRHAQWFLHSLGHTDIRMMDFETQSGYTKKEYLDYEMRFAGEAEKRGFTPALFQLIAWVMYAGWHGGESMKVLKTAPSDYRPQRDG